MVNKRRHLYFSTGVSLVTNIFRFLMWSANPTHKKKLCIVLHGRHKKYVLVFPMFHPERGIDLVCTQLGGREGGPPNACQSVQSVHGGGGIVVMRTYALCPQKSLEKAKNLTISVGIWWNIFKSLGIPCSLGRLVLAFLIFVQFIKTNRWYWWSFYNTE